ncbi:hypothetical protein ASE15_05335 [Oerskovia sp. Root22]|nr:hypothetical protein ASE15_05335 [Oerskovia sp. Root22]
MSLGVAGVIYVLANFPGSMNTHAAWFALLAYLMVGFLSGLVQPGRNLFTYIGALQIAIAGVLALVPVSRIWLGPLFAAGCLCVVSAILARDRVALLWGLGAAVMGIASWCYLLDGRLSFENKVVSSVLIAIGSLVVLSWAVRLVRRR